MAEDADSASDFVRPDDPVQNVTNVPSEVWETLPEDVRAVLEAAYGKAEVLKRQRQAEKERTYQAQLAAELVKADSRWIEVDCGMSSLGASIDESVADSHASYEKGLLGSDGGRRIGTERPTVHQFYGDLYSLRVLDEYDIYGYTEDDELSGIAGARPLVPEDEGILVNHRDREHPYQLYLNYREFLQAISKETSFIYMGRFWHPTRKEDGKKFLIAKRNAMTSIGGFCVDIDRVDDPASGYHQSASAMVNYLYANALSKAPELVPNYIMLSGTGLQLWYVFGEQIPLLSARKSPRRDKYQDVLKSLYRWFDERLPAPVMKVDVPCATISHAFRAPASPSKFGYPTRLLAMKGRRREMVSPLALSDYLGCNLEPYDLEDWDQEAYERIKDERRAAHRGRDADATERQVAWLQKLEKMGCVEGLPEKMTIADADALIKRGELVYTHRAQHRATGGHIDTTAGHRVAIRHRDPKLYEYTLRRIRGGESETGHRYHALFALAGLGWNCGIPQSRVKRDMLSLLGLSWAQEPGPHDGKPLSRADVKAALEGYCPLGCLRPREAVEDRLNWQYGPPQKRNGRDRRTHLWGDWENERGVPEVNTARANRELALRERARKTASKKTGELAKWLSDNPTGSKRKACKELNMSRSTVTKYWPEACAIAGVEDIRTGNHNPHDC